MNVYAGGVGKVSYQLFRRSEQPGQRNLDSGTWVAQLGQRNLGNATWARSFHGSGHAFPTRTRQRGILFIASLPRSRVFGVVHSSQPAVQAGNARS